MRILLWFMSKSVRLWFPSKSFIVSDFTFRSLIHFELILCMVLESVLISLFYMQLSSLTSTTYCRGSFSLLCILASFFKNKVHGFTSGLSLSIHLYFSFCSSTIVWSQADWFLQLLSFFSRLLWLFRSCMFPYKLGNCLF